MFSILSTLFWVACSGVALGGEVYKSAKTRRIIAEMDKDPYNPVKSKEYLKAHNSTYLEENIKVDMRTLRYRYKEDKEMAKIWFSAHSRFFEIPEGTNMTEFVEKYWDC